MNVTPRAEILFASHREETLQRKGQRSLSDLIGSVREALQRGERVVLTHIIDTSTYQDLGDLVRYVDDVLREVDGIAFSLDPAVDDETLAQWWPWWQSAVAACEVREVGICWTDPRLGPPVSDLKSEASVEEDVEPESLSVMHLADNPDGWDDRLESLIQPLGTWSRFIHPARITLRKETLDAFCADDRRDQRRIERQTRPRPWVFINLGRVDAANQDHAGLPDPELLESLIHKCLALDTLPHVGCGVSASALETAHPALEAIKNVCIAQSVPWLPLVLEELFVLAPDAASDANRWTLASPHGDRGASAITFDFVLGLSRSSLDPPASVLDQAYGLLPDNLRQPIIDNLSAAISRHNQGAQSKPPSYWLADHARETLAAKDVASCVGISPPAANQATEEQLSPSERAARRSGTAIDVLQVAVPDLWITTIPKLDLLMASTDPLPIERFSLDAFGIEANEHPFVGPADTMGYPYARHEGALIAGQLPDGIITGPKRVPKARPGKPLTILGLACTTLANHAAVIVQDGQVVATAQEERFRRRKQLGWHPPGRPDDTVVCDSALPLTRAYPNRSIKAVLETAGIEWKDIDCIAFNGIPARYFPTYSIHDPARPPRTIKAGRHIYIPHHLAHAASAYRVSGFDEAFIFTVDGRGERETAAFFEANGGEIRRVYDIRCGEPAETLIGGVYEYITTILGFGHYGQGSTMGLAAMGTPEIDMSEFLSARSRHDYNISDRGIFERYGHLARTRNDKLTRKHVTLAASVQYALEETVLNLIEDGLAGRRAKNLCLAGGVTLNCSMNQRIRTAFEVENIFVQPAAHDAGTALGAALEAHWEITGERPSFLMNRATLGNSYSDDTIEAVLKRFNIAYERSENIAKEVADRIVGGEIICWYQGGSEYGPRALGGRSIVADPRSPAIKDRLNVMKGRQSWRPLGPSMLAGHEETYFELAFESHFMLFTFPVKKERQADIPAVLHYDGTTRPQSVTPEANPLYHEMISHFYAQTNIPMVVNTSFNTAFEPIVERPEDAVASFLDLKADALAIGPFIVPRPRT